MNKIVLFYLFFGKKSEYFCYFSVCLLIKWSQFWSDHKISHSFQADLSLLNGWDIRGESVGISCAFCMHSNNFSTKHSDNLSIKTLPFHQLFCIKKNSPHKLTALLPLYLMVIIAPSSSNCDLSFLA